MLKIDIKHSMFTSEGKTNLEISVKIEIHELVCLFGQSGAGKTTLLRILAGLTKPDHGLITFGDTVWFDSEKKINIPPQKRNVGFMFQDYALFPNMSVEKNIRFAQKVKDSDAVEDLLFMFGIETLRNQNSAQLSGGQRQRVALARALAAKPALLMLDEPLSALDIEMRLALQEEILKVHRLLDTITLLVSHDVGDAMNLASSVIYIKNGKVLSQGKPSDVFNQCISPQNIRFLSSVKFPNLKFPTF